MPLPDFGEQRRRGGGSARDSSPRVVASECARQAKRARKRSYFLSYFLFQVAGSQKLIGQGANSKSALRLRRNVLCILGSGADSQPAGQKYFQVYYYSDCLPPPLLSRKEALPLSDKTRERNTTPRTRFPHKTVIPNARGRHRLLTVSRDLTAALWDLSRSPSSDMSSVDSSSGPLSHHPAWGLTSTSTTLADGTSIGGASGNKETFLSSSSASSSSTVGFYGETAPMRVSTSLGLPDSFPGMYPSTVAMHQFGRPHSGRQGMFGEDPRCGQWSMRQPGSRIGQGGADGETSLPVLFAAAGDEMVASVVQIAEGTRENVYPAHFVAPSGKRVYGGAARRSSSGALVARSVAVLPLRRLILLGCADGRIRVGT